jgi:formamidopyrimidine-DNA glycosylase
MPELPEVETIVRELRQKICGEVFRDVELLWQKSFESTDGLSIMNQTIKAIGRKGKYIIFDLSDGFLITHLRMTGQLIVKEMPPEELKHLRIIFRMQSEKYLLFYDLRKFGRIILTNDPQRVLVNTGPDALDTRFSTGYIHHQTRGKTQSIKSFLLDQRNIAGLGNIYIDESLFRAGLHPQSRAGGLTVKQVDRLYASIRHVLNAAMSRMGTTISDYRTTGGGFGENQHHLFVYGREGMTCLQCKMVIRKIKHGGRGTHFCPQCQKKVY